LILKFRFPKTKRKKLYYKLATRAWTAGDKKNLRVPVGSFYITQSFSHVICKRFGVWGSPGSRGQVGGVIVVLKTFTELVGRSGGSPVKEGHR